jgi:hypothetical protein
MVDIIDRLDALPASQQRELGAVLAQRGAEFNVYPLSYAQWRMWFVTRMHGAAPVYTVPYAFALTGQLDVAALDQAVQAVVRRHDALRTVFFDVDGDAYQMVRPALEIPLGVRRWRAQDAANSQLVRTLVEAEAQRTFDLRHGPLLVANVLTCDAGQHLFLLTLHHIVCDGWSMGIIFHELEEFYRAALDGRTPDLPPLPMRYVDFARWQAATLSGQPLERQLDYWRGMLAGAPDTTTFPGLLRSDEPPSTAPAHIGESELESWPAALARSVEEYSRHASVTPFITMLAAFAAVLHHRAGLRDFVVGTPVANRNRLELEHLVGFFVNMLPLRLRPAGTMTFRELVQHAREVSLGAQANQDIPFEMLVEQLAPHRQGSGNPLFEICFAVEEPDTQTLRLPGLDVSLVQGRNGTVKFDLTVAFVLLEAELKASADYRPSRLRRAQVQALLAATRRLLERAIAAPDEPLARLAGEVPDAERAS